MKLPVVTKCCYLLFTVLCGSSYGDTSDNCTAPTFKNATCGSECGCHQYFPKASFVGDSVIMTVKPVGTNLTIRWWTANVNPIVGNDGRYFLKNNNRTLIWDTATEGRKVFYINVTNSCGMSSKACFLVVPFCHKCLNCPYVDNTTDSRNVYEHSKFKVTNSITSNKSIFLQWCFIGANKQRNCCICDNTVGVNPGICSQKDWNLNTTYGDECSYQSTCTLTVKNIAMKYNGGAFVSEAVIVRYQHNETLLGSQTNITIIHNSRNYLPYIISGTGALVGVLVIVAISHGVVHLIRVQRQTWRRRGYLSIPSSDYLPVNSPVSVSQQHADSDSGSVISDDFSQLNIGTPV